MKNELKEVTTSTELTIGDLLYRRKGLVMHVGIYLGNSLILHNTPKQGEHQTDFTTFANGKTVFAQSTGLPAQTVIDRAAQVLATPAPYRLLNHNCEHTANSVLHEDEMSRQLSEIIVWALVGGALGKSIGRKSMYIGGFIGALGGLLSLPRMFWIK